MQGPLKAPGAIQEGWGEQTTFWKLLCAQPCPKCSASRTKPPLSHLTHSRKLRASTCWGLQAGQWRKDSNPGRPVINCLNWATVWASSGRLFYIQTLRGTRAGAGAGVMSLCTWLHEGYQAAPGVAFLSWGCLPLPASAWVELEHSVFSRCLAELRQWPFHIFQPLCNTLVPTAMETWVTGVPFHGLFHKVNARINTNLKDLKSRRGTCI